MGHVTVNAHNAPDRSDWLTPPEFLELVRAVGPIVFDPATSYKNPTKARHYCTGGNLAFSLGCGLSLDWDTVAAPDGLIYINPPWGAHLSGPVDPTYEIKRKAKLIGVGRGWAAKIAQRNGATLALTPTRTDSEWFSVLHRWCSWRLDWRSPVLGARIQFIDPDTGETRGGNNSACTVFFRGPDYLVSRFASAFGVHGTMIPGTETLTGLLAARLT